MDLIEQADYTLTVTEHPLITPDGIKWHPVYWEVRNSAQGYRVCQAIRQSDASPWMDTDGEGEWATWDEHALKAAGVPPIILDRMKERRLI